MNDHRSFSLLFVFVPAAVISSDDNVVVVAAAAVAAAAVAAAASDDASFDFLQRTPPDCATSAGS